MGKLLVVVVVFGRLHVRKKSKNIDNIWCYAAAGVYFMVSDLNDVLALHAAVRGVLARIISCQPGAVLMTAANSPWRAGSQPTTQPRAAPTTQWGLGVI